MGRSKLPHTWRRLTTAQARERRARLTLPVRVRNAESAGPLESAGLAGLRYVDAVATRGIRRIGNRGHFRYVDPQGRVLRDRSQLQRIRSLVIPPAWKDVWICPHPHGHLQATGRDARGRKQYRYHARWREVRDEVKYGRLIAFARALPRIRRRLGADMRRSGLQRQRVLATVVQLLEKTLIRIGNEEYARDNDSYGLTTMRDRHAKVNGARIRFEFRGKSGLRHAVDLHDARLARIVKACRDLPGHELFQYVDDEGNRQTIDSGDVNQYLRELGGENFTAKDFRTWAGTVLAARALGSLAGFASQAQAKRNIAKAVQHVACRLGNTKAVCRKSYIHPAVFDCYMDGVTLATLDPRTSGAGVRKAGAPLDPDEAAVVALIQRRLLKTA
jgi:DNA topoisomerase-1